MLNSSISKLDTESSFQGLSKASLTPGDSHNLFLSTIGAAYLFTVSTLAIPSKLILRKNLGERQIPIPGFIISIIFHLYIGIVYIFYIFLDRDLTYSEFSPINPLFLYLDVIIFLGIVHYVKSFRNASAGVYFYSHYRGDSRIVIRLLSDKYLSQRRKDGSYLLFIGMVFEPLIVIIAGLLVVFFFSEVLFLSIAELTGFDLTVASDQVTSFMNFKYWIQISGTFFAFSGFCLALEEFGIALRKRNAVLDILDSEYDMQYILNKKGQQIFEENFRDESSISSDASNLHFLKVIVPGVSVEDFQEM